MHRNFSISLLITLGLFTLGCFKKKAESESQSKKVKIVKSQFDGSLSKDEGNNKPLPGPEALSKESATIKTAHGPIKIKFYPKHAPNTVMRIQELIKNGFYDGLTFHRHEPGFVIQGGDPTGTGRGGSGKNLKAEFNNLKHTLGMIGMARGADEDSADSQFYIMLGEASHLDHKYTIFAKVVSGMDNAKKLKQGDKILSFNISK